MQTFGAFSTNGLCLCTKIALDKKDALAKLTPYIKTLRMHKDYLRDWLDNQIVHIVDKLERGAFQRDDEPVCKHKLFKCRVPSGDSCVPIYHQVCQVCKWDDTKGVVMPDLIWENWAVRQFDESQHKHPELAQIP